MDQKEIEVINRTLLARFLQRLNKGEVVAAIVTVQADGKGIGWYPAIESQSKELLEYLRKKPDEIEIERKL